jgi:putative membrane protein
VGGIDRRKVRDGHAAPACSTVSFARGQHAGHRARSIGFHGGGNMRLLLVWLINAAALFALPYLMSSIKVDSLASALIAALVLGLINTFIRPVLVLLTLPATLLTLGLFIFVINGLLFWFVGSFIEGFHVAGFWSAVIGAILYSIISWALSALLLPKKGVAGGR